MRSSSDLVKTSVLPFTRFVIFKVNDKGDLTNSHKVNASVFFCLARQSARHIQAYSELICGRKRDGRPRQPAGWMRPVGTVDSGRLCHGADRATGLSGQEATTLDMSELLHVDVCTTIPDCISLYLLLLPMAQRS